MQPTKSAKYIFWQNRTNAIFGKSKLDCTIKSYDSTPLMRNPTAKMLNNVRKLVCVSLFFISSIKKQFVPTYESKFCIVLIFPSSAKTNKSQ